MALSLYEICVPNYLQTLAAVGGFLEKGRAWAQEAGKSPDDLVGARLAGDMLPMSFQIVSVAQHSRGAIEGAAGGVFGPPRDPGNLDYAGLQAIVAETRAALEQVKPDDVNALEGRDMIFQLGKNAIPFVVKDFILSFSLPNFYFHATTAYDLLRQAGAPLGKRDFLGRMRIKA